MAVVGVGWDRREEWVFEPLCPLGGHEALWVSTWVLESRSLIQIPGLLPPCVLLGGLLKLGTSGSPSVLRG